MILTKRKIPKELLYFRALQKRRYLSTNNKRKLDAFEKGYAGELLYDSIYDEIVSHLYVFRDIYMNIDNNILQCDALIVCDKGFIIHEIKNFKGIYKYENNKWYVRHNQISDDPILQLNRTANKLVKFKYIYNLNFSSVGKVIFTSPEFSLETDHPSISDHTILRHQLRPYLYSLNELKSTHQADILVEIIKNHIVDNPYFNYTTDFEELNKGVYCRKCSSFNLKKSNIHFKCLDCGNKDTIHTIIVQALSDFDILFNNEFITRKNLWEFLGKQISESTINRYLRKYCNKINKGPATKYKFKFYDFDDAMKNEMRLWRYKDMPKIDISEHNIIENMK